MMDVECNTYPEESRHRPADIRQLHTTPKRPIKDIQPRRVDLAPLHHPICRPRLDRDLQPGPLGRFDIVHRRHLPVRAPRLRRRGVERLAHPVRVLGDVADVGEVGLDEVRQDVLRPVCCSSSSTCRAVGVGCCVYAHPVAAFAVGQGEVR